MAVIVFEFDYLNGRCASCELNNTCEPTEYTLTAHDICLYPVDKALYMGILNGDGFEIYKCNIWGKYCSKQGLIRSLKGSSIFKIEKYIGKEPDSKQNSNYSVYICLKTNTSEVFCGYFSTFFNFSDQIAFEQKMHLISKGKSMADKEIGEYNTKDRVILYSRDRDQLIQTKIYLLSTETDPASESSQVKQKSFDKLRKLEETQNDCVYPDPYYLRSNQGNCRSICPNFIEITENPFDDDNEKGNCTNECCGGDRFRYKNGINKYSNGTDKEYCIASCSLGNFNYFYFDNHFRTCIQACEDTFYINLTELTGTFSKDDMINQTGPFECIPKCGEFELVTEAKKYCLSVCPVEMFVNDTTNRRNLEGASTSLESCNDERPTYATENSGIFCLDECDTLSGYKYTAPGNKCVTSCADKGYDFVFYQESVPFCVEECPSTSQYFRRVGNESFCMDACTPSEFLKLVNEPETLENTVLNLDEHSIECVSSCEAIVFSSNLVYSVGSHTKTFCLDKCPSSFYFLTDADANEECVSECSAPFKYHTPDRKCVESCSDEGFSFVKDDNSCSNQCDMFWFEISNGLSKCVSECTPPLKYANADKKCFETCLEAGYEFVLEDLSCSDYCFGYIQDDIYCVSACSPENPLIENDYCVEKCSINAPFILNYEICLSSCPNRAFDNICVDDCDDYKIAEYYARNNLVYNSKPFTSFSGKCLEKCTEPGFSFTRLDTMECVNACPEEGPKYSDNNNICVEDCSDTELAFVDEETRRCVSKCTGLRHLVAPPNNKCIDICPSDKPIINQKALCKEKEDCNDFMLECTNNCPGKIFFRHFQGTEVIFTCECPEFFKPNKERDCELNCDTSIGLIPDSKGETCIHCWTSFKKVMSNGECASKCALGRAPDHNFVCQACFDLDLWTNDAERCIPKEMCNPLSYFRESTKQCVKCNETGYKIVKEEGKQSFCAFTDCSEGHIAEEISTTVCYICKENKFYYKQQCQSLCPEETDYNFQNRSCVKSCAQTCSSSCCRKGSCTENKCKCNLGFVGARCEVEIHEAEAIFDAEISFLVDKMKNRILFPNETRILDDLLKLTQSRLRTMFESNKLKIFADNLISLIDKHYVSYSFQIGLFSILDRLIDISFQLNSTRLLESVVERIDLFSNNVQIFNTTSREEPNFEQIFNSKYEGNNIEVHFGAKIADFPQISIEDCSDKIKNDLNLENYSFPFRFLNFSSRIVKTLLRNTPNALVISSDPRRELYIYTKKGILPINTVCSNKYIDSVFPTELSASKKALVKTFNIQNVNLFDKNDKFFVDKCFPFKEEGKDLTLAQRKAKFYQEPKEICKESLSSVCQITDKEGGKCVCRGIREKKKSTLEKLAQTYPQTNFNLVTCTETIKQAKLTGNSGFLLSLIIFSICIIVTCLFSAEKDNRLIKNKIDVIIYQSISLFEPDSMNKDIFFIECAELSANLNALILINDIKNIEIDSNSFKNALPTVKDLNKLDFDSLLLVDTRNSFQFAVDTFRDTHPFGKVFLKHSLEGAPFYSVMLFFTELYLNITLNAFFVEDSDIEQKDELFSFKSVLRQLLTSFWVYTTTKFCFLFINLFIPHSPKEEQIVRKSLISSSNHTTIRLHNKLRTKERPSMLIFAFICLICNGFATYFLVIFTEIYSQSSSVWITNVFTTLFLEYAVILMIVPGFLIFSRILSGIFPSAVWIHRLAINLKNTDLGSDILSI